MKSILHSAVDWHSACTLASGFDRLSEIASLVRSCPTIASSRAAPATAGRPVGDRFAL